MAADVDHSPPQLPFDQEVQRRFFVTFSISSLPASFSWVERGGSALCVEEDGLTRLSMFVTPNGWSRRPFFFLPSPCVRRVTTEGILSFVFVLFSPGVKNSSKDPPFSPTAERESGVSRCLPRLLPLETNQPFPRVATKESVREVPLEVPFIPGIFTFLQI